MSTASLKQNVKQHTNTLSDDLATVKEKALEMNQAIGQTAYDLKDTAQEAIVNTYDNAKEKYSDLEDTLSNFCREKPLRAVGIAVAAGFVLAHLLRKK